MNALFEVKFWTFKHDLIGDDYDVGFSRYHDKTEKLKATSEIQKMHYIESRDSTYILKNRKLKEAIIELTDSLKLNTCVKCKWNTPYDLQLVLSNGLLANISVSLHTGDIDSLTLDKSLIAKVGNNIISDAILESNFAAVTYSNIPTFHYFFSIITDKFIGLIQTQELNVTQLPLPGPIGRKLQRNIIYSNFNNLACIWWTNSTDEARPWTADDERSNLVLISLEGFVEEKSNIVCHRNSESDPLSVVFSINDNNKLLSVEQAPAENGCTQINLVCYDAKQTSKHSLPRDNSRKIFKLSSSVLVCSWSNDQQRLVLYCLDGTMCIVHLEKCIIVKGHTKLNVNSIIWHPSDLFYVVFSDCSEMQIHDISLNVWKTSILSDQFKNGKETFEFSSILRSAPIFQLAAWNKLNLDQGVVVDCCDHLLINFEGFSFGLLRIFYPAETQAYWSPLYLVQFYLRNGQIDYAIKFTSSLNWDRERDGTFASLACIINYLLRQPLTAESENQFECALAIFYSPVSNWDKDIQFTYKKNVDNLARRYFKHLIRYSAFEKAFLMAVDLNEEDLFMKLHLVAKKSGEDILAKASLKKAKIIKQKIETNEEEDLEDNYEYTAYDTDLSKEDISITEKISKAKSQDEPFERFKCKDVRTIYDHEREINEIQAELTSNMINEFTEILFND
ncbi:DgyrCDS9079 [Dimorphilus gyrociliatus]|uniref:DgyrCDS9079 n=1 Tax=Dimorphilus gyrociliatus TaxID=2664684 RepID=A0A7I8VWC9_9ANNE|nr:DgyrCDS9079 [Dimorphilus gyrociliatus]